MTDKRLGWLTVHQVGEGVRIHGPAEWLKGRPIVAAYLSKTDALDLAIQILKAVK